MEDTKLEFIPFNAINEFMRPDFRMTVVRTALSSLTTLPHMLREPIDKLTRKFVKVPGFRNPEKAPATVKLLPLLQAFEKSPELVAAILAAWAENQAELRTQVYEVLQSRGWVMFPTEIKSMTDLPLPKTERDWGVLPPQADRSRLPGFVVFWPKKEDYEAIYQTFGDRFPQAEASIDQVSLMSVWLTMRLPYRHVLDDGTVMDANDGHDHTNHSDEASDSNIESDHRYRGEAE